MLELNLFTIFLTFVIILICNIIYYTIKIYNLRKRYAHIPGPPANGIIGFYLGNLLEIRCKPDFIKTHFKWIEF